MMALPAFRARSWRFKLRETLIARASRRNSRWVNVPAFRISARLSTRDHVSDRTHAFSWRSFTGGFSTASTNYANIVSLYAGGRERGGVGRGRRSCSYCLFALD